MRISPKDNTTRVMTRAVSTAVLVMGGRVSGKVNVASSPISSMLTPISRIGFMNGNASPNPGPNIPWEVCMISASSGAKISKFNDG